MIDARVDFFEAAFCDCRRSVRLDDRMLELPVRLSSPSFFSSCTRLPCWGQDILFYYQGDPKKWTILGFMQQKECSQSDEIQLRYNKTD